MAPEYKDYYKTLGVARSAAKDDIAKAYKKLAKKYHPDLNPGDKSAEENFKDITEAYEVLKDDEKRKLYDQLGPDWQNASQFGGFGGAGGPGGGFGDFGNGTQFTFNGQRMDGSGFSDFFETLFGGGRFGGAQDGGFGGGRAARARRGRDVEAEIAIPLEAVQQGGKRQITLQDEGRARTLEVNIPAGIHEGAKLRLGGLGQPGLNGAPAGDLFMKVRYAPHALFRVDGQNLIHEARVMPWVAALGGKVRVPTLEGEVELSVPAASASGRTMRLRGKGLGKGAERGDLLIRLGIDMPADLSERETQLWRELAELRGKRG